MVNSRRELLTKAWEGEVLGEAFFLSAADALPDHADDLALLAHVEHTTASLIEPIARAEGCVIDVEAQRRAGRELGGSLAGQPWKDVLENLRSALPGFYALYEQLGSVLPGELPHELMVHERAVAEFATRSIAGEDAPRAAVTAYLDRHQPS